MSRYKDSNKYKIYGEDAILAARFDKYLDATLRNCRADYLKALSKRKQREIPYEDLPDAEKETVQESSAADNEIESLLFWEALKTHLHSFQIRRQRVDVSVAVQFIQHRSLYKPGKENPIVTLRQFFQFLHKGIRITGAACDDQFFIRLDILEGLNQISNPLFWHQTTEEQYV